MNIPRKVIAISLLAFASSILSAAPQDNPVTSLIPSVQTVDLPSTIAVAGAGISSGQPTGFVNVLTHLNGPVYLALAQDIHGTTSKTRIGIETVFFRAGNLYVTGKGNAGLASGSTATGGAYGVGGSVNYDLRRARLPGWLVGFSGTFDYSNIADLGREIRLANGRREYERIFSAGTYRFYVGRYWR